MTFKRTPTRRDIQRSTFEQALMLQGIVDKRQPPALLPDRQRKPKDWEKISEHQHQVAVCDWWRDECVKYRLPEFALFAVPNAGKRSPYSAELMKREGLRPGAPDMILAVPNKRYAGCFLEMKVAPNKQTDDQEKFIKYLQSVGYRASVHWSGDEAIAEITNYLQGR